MFLFASCLTFCYHFFIGWLAGWLGVLVGRYLIGVHFYLFLLNFEGFEMALFLFYFHIFSE